jgi:hypothetical protein
LGTLPDLVNYFSYLSGFAPEMAKHGFKNEPISPGPASALRRGLPWRDNTGILSCYVKITVLVEINLPFQSQVWARGMRKKDMSMLKA